MPHTDLTAEDLASSSITTTSNTATSAARSTTDEVFAIGKERGRLRCTRDQFVDAFCDIFWPNPPMADLIPRLKANGYRLVLASNTNAGPLRPLPRAVPRRARPLRRDRGVARGRGPQAARQSSSSTPTGWPACEKAECLFVDDLAENVAAAREFGWHAIHYTRFDDLVPDCGRSACGSIDLTDELDRL